jgi:hypothetical protein
MLDKETDALVKCVEVLQDLDYDSKCFVIETIIRKFRIGSSPVVTTQTSHNTMDSTHYLPTNYVQEDITPQEENYPTLKKLVLDSLPKSEAEWVLCYAFYSSNYGTDFFTRENIIEKYKESNRSKQTRLGNLTSNINACMKKNWIKDVNNNEYAFNQEGIFYVKEILKGNSTSKEIKRTKKVKKQKANSDNNE